jgi:hypothetical protein
MSWAFYIVAMFICASCISMFFFMPETKFSGARPSIYLPTSDSTKEEGEHKIEDVAITTNENSDGHPAAPLKRSYLRELALWEAPDPNESFRNLLLRPFVLLAYPTVLWACLVYGMSLGWNVIIGATVAQLFEPQYGFDSQAQGLVFLSPFVGSLVGTWLCGSLSDTVANIATKRNSGVREPEMRLPICALGSFLTFFGALTAGLTYHYNTHWAGPVVGLGILTAGAQIGVALSMSYALDCHKEVSGPRKTAEILTNPCAALYRAYGDRGVVEIRHRLDMDLGHQRLDSSGGHARCVHGHCEYQCRRSFDNHSTLLPGEEHSHMAC